MTKVFKKTRCLLIPVLVCIAVLLLMKTILFLGYVPTASMEPTLPAGSYVLGLRVHGPLSKGDVIIFNHGGRVLLKRVAATAGDTITRPDGSFMTVPGECYYVLGDNSENSIDSRYWKDPFVKEKDVLALVLLC